MISKKINPPWQIWIWLGLAAILSAVNIVPRFRAEQSNRAVTLIVESDVAGDLGAAQGLSLSESLAKLAESGVGMVSCSERTAGEMLSNGLLKLDPLPDGRYQVSGPEAVLREIRSTYRARFNRDIGVGGSIVIRDPSRLRTTQLGIDPSEIAAARSAGVVVMARVGNPAGATPSYIDFAVQRMARQGAVAYLPLGEEVLGNDQMIGVTADDLKREGIVYASAEFAKISGDSKMVKLMPESTIRLHAAQSAELIRMTPSGIIERYSKAARERNIRYLLLRPAASASAHPLDDFGDLIRKINRELAKDRMEVKPARPFDEPESNSMLKGLLGLSLIPGLAYGMLSVLADGKRARFSLVVWVISALIGVMAFVATLREYVSLAGAVLFPIAGFGWFIEHTRAKPLLAYLGISAFSLVGGLQVAGMLTGLPYMLHLDQFTGVKVVVFVPIFATAYMLLSSVAPLGQLLDQKIAWRGLLTALVILGALMFMASRTGNDNPTGVSGLELKFRSLLDRALLVRPRTKEFLIGHPALIFGLCWWNRIRPESPSRLIAATIIAAGAIGQTSVVNTFCHLHTPIDLSVLRVLSGHLLGCILGLLGWAVFSRFVPLSSVGEDN